MLRHERSAPIWLFSFVDLAFLLLIAFTQIGPDHDSASEDLALLEVPRILGPGQPLDPALTGSAAWQLRVYPLAVEEDAQHTPYTLVEPGTDATLAEPIGAEDLTTHLAVLRQRDSAKPILAPHDDARSADLLIAVALLEDTWQDGRQVAVRPTSPDAGAPIAEVSAR